MHRRAWGERPLLPRSGLASFVRVLVPAAMKGGHDPARRIEVRGDPVAGSAPGPGRAAGPWEDCARPGLTSVAAEPDHVFLVAGEDWLAPTGKSMAIPTRRPATSM
jgi:hypothetical protein